MASDGTVAGPRLREIRAALHARVEETSLRNTAREVGISPGGLRNTLKGAVPNWQILELLRRWYVKDRIRSAEPALETYHLVLDQMLAAVPERDQRSAKLRVLAEIESTHLQLGCDPPEWLAPLRAEIVAESRAGGAGSE